MQSSRDQPLKTQSSGKGDPQTYAIIGAAMAVHRELRNGFLEGVYQEAFAYELGERSIPFEREATLDIWYRGTRLDCYYRADFICYGSVVVEIKALSAIGPVEDAQVINYLKASGLHRALLLNFGKRELEYKRLVFSGRE